eukprot:CAMPEP_0119083980 /NCGR_PEP_ID=MMETSP1178-20130426/127704_1 /TAXON_ID=33656 /ORGANISM="unid sp, Strain CCMP2000" /LENGTH=378 /DNA_ID=CAMNT_0007066901 /DNA_START=32 /DNA_END=1168 /DNA_ORIENTATION=+
MGAFRGGAFHGGAQGANSSSVSPPHNHARFVVLKQGHAGSLWLHSLLNAQPGVLSYFEFDGCDKGSGGDGGGGDDDGDTKKAAYLEGSISNVLSQGCCHAPACSSVGHARFAPAGTGPDTAASFAYACMRLELCNGRCQPRPWPGCAAVGLQRKLNSNALRLLQPLFVGHTQPARLVLLVRDNAVKHTFSSLRTRCREMNANHVRNASRLAATARTRVQIPPPLLFGRAVMQLRQRTDLVQEAEALGAASGSGVHVLVYERLQLDSRLEMAGLFRFLGLTTFNQSAVGSTLLKAAPEALSRALANFSAHERLFGGWPCLHQMLISTEPRTFARGCAPLDAPAIAALPDEMARRAARSDFTGVLAAAKGKARQIRCVAE